MNEWTKCSDRLPDSALPVLALSKSRKHYVAEYFHREDMWCDMDGSLFNQNAITHWMPLPAPPAEDE